MTLTTALFKRLYQAIEEDRKSDAVLLLTQVFDHQNSPEAERYRAFLSGLRDMGDQFNDSGNPLEAERHFVLALELFDKFFYGDLREGLALNRRLCELYERSGEIEKLQVQLDRAYELVRRMLADVSAVAMSSGQQRTGTDSRTTQSSEGSPHIDRDRPLKVLLIEDNPDDVGLVQETLDGAGMPLSLDWAETLSDGLQRLQERPIDVVLLDLCLPDSQNAQTIRALRNDAPRVPIVVLTGNDDKELILEALRTGARDYLIKGRVDPQQLVGSLNNAVHSRIAHQAADWENSLRVDTVRQMMHMMAQPAILLDTKYSIVEANRKFCDIIPCIEDIVRGTSFLELCPHFPRTEFGELLETGGRRKFSELSLETRNQGSVKFKAEVGTIIDAFHNVHWLLVQFQ